MLKFLTRIPTRPTPTKIVMKSRLSDELREEHNLLSKKIGIDPRASLDLENRMKDIVDFLVGEGIELYDYGHVVNYMTALARKSKKELVWKALRRSVLRKNEMSYSIDQSHSDTFSVYTRPIPVEILRNVDKLITKFGADNLVFAVSDFEVPNPDPFIRVNWVGNNNYIIFGMWDEPGYTLAHTQAASELKKL